MCDRVCYSIPRHNSNFIPHANAMAPSAPTVIARFTSERRPMLVEVRETAIALASHPLLKGGRRHLRIMARLSTRLHNLELDLAKRELVEFGASCYAMLEVSEADAAGGNGVSEGQYINTATSLKRSITFFEETLEEVERVIEARRLRQTGATPPPADYSIYQRPHPEGKTGKKAA